MCPRWVPNFATEAQRNTETKNIVSSVFSVPLWQKAFIADMACYSLKSCTPH